MDVPRVELGAPADLADVSELGDGELDANQQTALNVVASAIPLDWRRGQVERADLARFTFSPEDVVVAVGQDGLAPTWRSTWTASR